MWKKLLNFLPCMKQLWILGLRLRFQIATLSPGDWCLENIFVPSLFTFFLVLVRYCIQISIDFILELPIGKTVTSRSICSCQAQTKYNKYFMFISFFVWFTAESNISNIAIWLMSGQKQVSITRYLAEYSPLVIPPIPVWSQGYYNRVTDITGNGSPLLANSVILNLWMLNGITAT